MGVLKAVVKSIFNSVGLEIVNLKAYQKNNVEQQKRKEELQELTSVFNRMELIISKSQFKEADILNEFNFLQFSCNKLAKSKAQLFQDLFVLYLNKEKRNGFFVEFGATDGISLSNTYLLEKDYGWSGLLCEPGKVWKEKLAVNRNCKIDYRCVWSKTGDEFIFNETSIPELSSLEMFNDADYHSESRKDGKTYPVETISLNDLLIQYQAPRQIDYLSIDTEGSEYEILNAFDFMKYNVSIITVEHNFSAKRNEIYNLLVSKGYKRVFEKISLFDDWYIREPFILSFNEQG